MNLEAVGSQFHCGSQLHLGHLVLDDEAGIPQDFPPEKVVFSLPSIATMALWLITVGFRHHHVCPSKEHVFHCQVFWCLPFQSKADRLGGQGTVCTQMRLDLVRGQKSQEGTNADFFQFYQDCVGEPSF